MPVPSLFCCACIPCMCRSEAGSSSQTWLLLDHWAATFIPPGHVPTLQGRVAVPFCDFFPRSLSFETCQETIKRHRAKFVYFPMGALGASTVNLVVSNAIFEQNHSISELFVTLNSSEEANGLDHDCSMADWIGRAFVDAAAKARILCAWNLFAFCEIQHAALPTISCEIEFPGWSWNCWSPKCEWFANIKTEKAVTELFDAQRFQGFIFFMLMKNQDLMCVCVCVCV